MPGKINKLLHWHYYREWIIHYGGGLYDRVDRHHVFLMASGLAFAALMCIIPLILIIFAILGMVLGKPSIAQEIDILIERIVPYESYASFVKQLILSRVGEFTIYKNAAGIIGLFGLLFAATSLFSGMRTTLNTVYRVPSPESVLIGKLRDLGLVVLVLLYFLLSTTLLPSLEITKELADRVAALSFLRFDFVENLIVGAASFLIIWVAFLVVYFLVPYERPPKRVVVVSALSAAVLWELAKQLFGFYITHFVTLKLVYGAYVLLIVVAFWIYYTSLVFILGAEIGQLYRERLEKRRLESVCDI